MTYVSEVLADSPALYWRLNETSPTTTAADTSGNANTGTITGATYSVAGATPDGDTALTLDATTGRVKGDAILNPGIVTIEVWVFLTAWPAISGCVATWNDNDSTGTSDKTLWIDATGGARFYYYDGANTRLTPSPASKVPLNDWVHLVGTMDGAVGHVYQNAVEVTKVTGGTTTFTGYANARFSAGYSADGGVGGIARLAAGRDEVAVYTSALTPARIAAHYAAAMVEGNKMRRWLR